MLARNPLLWTFRTLFLLGLGIVGAIATGNPLYLGLSVLGFGLLFFLLRREAVEASPKWVTTLNTGREQAIKGDWPEATATFQAALAQCRGDRPRRIATTDIGLLLLQANRKGEAEPYLREAVTLTSRAFGPMAPRTVALRDKLSDLYVSTGQAWQAADLQGGAMAASAAARGDPTSSLGAAETAARYAEALQLAGNSAEASASNQQALEKIDKADPHSPLFVQAVISASRYAAASGDRERAIELLVKALDNADPDRQGKLIDDARSSLVELYSATDRYAEAISALEQRLKGRAGLEPSRHAEMRRQPADLMDNAGRSEEAVKQRRLARTLDSMVAAAGHGPSAEARSE